MQLQNVNGFIIDLDGTVYKGNKAIEGAAQTIAYLRSLGKRIVFLSNRGNISKVMCHNNLTRMGLEVHLEEIILSSTVSAAYIKHHYEASAVWVLGDEGLREELRNAGVLLAELPEALMIGDSLESDIRLGKKAGMKTALVLTGNLTRAEVELSELKPDWIWNSFADLQELMIIHEEAEGRVG